MGKLTKIALDSASVSPARSLAFVIGQRKVVRDLASIAERWRILALYACTGAIVAALTSLVLPERFDSNATIVVDTPRQGDLSGGLAEVATEFGITGLESQRTPEFYRDLMQTRAVLERVATATYRVPSTPTPSPLFALYTGKDSLTPRIMEKMG